MELVGSVDAADLEALQRHNEEQEQDSLLVSRGIVEQCIGSVYEDGEIRHQHLHF